MRSWRRPHVLVVLALLSGRAAAEDIPPWAPGPALFAVTPFENHVARGSALEWIVAEAPFEIAEKTEAVLGLDPIGGRLYVPGEWVPAEADTVAAYGAKVGATYVITGWFDRPGTDLRIAVLIWKIQHGAATVAGQAQRSGDAKLYHRILGEAMGEAWSKAGIAVDVDRIDRLVHQLGTTPDTYAVTLMGRGLGELTGALGAMAASLGSGSAAAPGPDLKGAEHDLERAVFVDPKQAEAQRLLGELYLAQNEPKAAGRAAAKFNYAADLAPDDLAALRAAAGAAAAGAKWEVALEIDRKLVARRPWDLDARYQLGQAMWELGDAAASEKQLEQVTAHKPDHLAARRVLVLIHASRSDTPRLVAELEAIAARAPDDLEIKGELATGYGALGEWTKAVAELEAIAAARAPDLPLLMRIGDAHVKTGELDVALTWYGKARQLAPESSLPGFAAAQALLDAGKLNEARFAYTNLQKYLADLPAAEEALGVIAIMKGDGSSAAWYLRRAVREAPRSLVTRQAAIAAELMRKDAPAALGQLEPAIAAWPDDAELRYLAGIAHAQAGDGAAARAELALAVKMSPGFVQAQSALGALDAGGSVALDYKPEVVRPWGNGEALGAALDRFAVLDASMAIIRVEYQAQLVALLGAAGVGPAAKARPKGCPLDQLAPAWSAAQAALARYIKLGTELEATYRFIARHDDAGLVAGLLPNARTAVAAAKKNFRLALADAGELRAEWARGLGPELRAIGCSDRLLAAAVADPSHYHVIEEDKPDTLPTQAPPRAKPRSTFFVDNTRCADPVDVWIDGVEIGQVAPGRRSALVADGGERTLCLLGPGAAQCGDRGTVRQVYLHDGWSVTQYCAK